MLAFGENEGGHLGAGVDLDSFKSLQKSLLGSEHLLLFVDELTGLADAAHELEPVTHDELKLVERKRDDHGRDLARVVAGTEGHDEWVERVSHPLAKFAVLELKVRQQASAVHVEGALHDLRGLLIESELLH